MRFHATRLVGRALLLATSAAIAFHAPPTEGAVVCTDTPKTVWKTASGGNGHTYQGVCATMTWTQANAAARAAGGHLVTLQSDAENDFVFALINDQSFWNVVSGNYNLGPWIGGSQPPGSAEPNSGWSWSNGESFGYTHWHSGEPNQFDGKEEDYALYFNGSAPNRDNSWNDTIGSDLAAYVIEWQNSLD